MHTVAQADSRGKWQKHTGPPPAPRGKASSCLRAKKYPVRRYERQLIVRFKPEHRSQKLTIHYCQIFKTIKYSIIHSYCCGKNSNENIKPKLLSTFYFAETFGSLTVVKTSKQAPPKNNQTKKQTDKQTKQSLVTESRFK